MKYFEVVYDHKTAIETYNALYIHTFILLSPSLSY